VRHREERGEEHIMPTILDPATEAEYLQLVRAFPLVSIRDDAHLAEALGVIDRLIERSERSVAEEAYLGALTDLVETYEDAHVAIPPTSGVEALRYLMEENGLIQTDLVPLLGTPSVVSEVLAGKRRLSLAHIRRLAAHFGLPADVFIDTSVEGSQE
jgi:HTH-type transcriptional regulator / antitoxin HigA